MSYIDEIQEDLIEARDKIASVSRDLGDVSITLGNLNKEKMQANGLLVEAHALFTQVLPLISEDEEGIKREILNCQSQIGKHIRGEKLDG